jgi:hypothetical protein
MVEPSISLINKAHVYVSCALLQSFKIDGKALNFFAKQAECLWYMVKDVEG